MLPPPAMPPGGGSHDPAYGRRPDMDPEIVDPFGLGPGGTMPPEEPTPPPKTHSPWLHLLLFTVTLVTTTLAGSEWIGKPAISEQGWSWEAFWGGLAFSVPFLGILTVHEFGHYFAARRYQMRVTLPYYLPMWLGFVGALSIGTLGAYIRILQRISSRRAIFDVGAAGPLAGYVAALIVLAWGYLTLPPPEYIFTIHPEYASYGLGYAQIVYDQMPEGSMLRLGQNLTVWLCETLFVTDPARLPNPFEMMHYPVIFAGYVALFFTALNLLPIGQLDGGHILYGLCGPRWHALISPMTLIALVTYAGLGVPEPIVVSGLVSTEGYVLLRNVLYVGFLYLVLGRAMPGKMAGFQLAFTVFIVQYAFKLWAPEIEGYPGWLVFCFVVGRILGVHYPDHGDRRPLDQGRVLVGLIALLVFVASFTFEPFGIR